MGSIPEIVTLSPTLVIKGDGMPVVVMVSMSAVSSMVMVGDCDLAVLPTVTTVISANISDTTNGCLDLASRMF